MSETRPGAVNASVGYDGYGRLTSYVRTGQASQANVYNGMDDRVQATGGTVVRRYLYDGQGRVLGEYGVSATNAIAESIWLSPDAANENIHFGGAVGCLVA